MPGDCTLVREGGRLCAILAALTVLRAGPPTTAADGDGDGAVIVRVRVPVLQEQSVADERLHGCRRFRELLDGVLNVQLSPQSRPRARDSTADRTAAGVEHATTATGMLPGAYAQPRPAVPPPSRRQWRRRGGGGGGDGGGTAANVMRRSKRWSRIIVVRAIDFSEAS